ncbi:MAG: hypothetical protein K0R54_5009 [Clostridiaceae bacterium]|nr:hypothetical protein [Clostridiaceae bacterium]
MISNGHAIKIGFTTQEVNKRIQQLQTGCSDKLEVIYILENSTREVEQSLHRYFGKNGNDYNIRNEWYDLKFVKNWIHKKKLELKVQRKLGLIE